MQVSLFRLYLITFFFGWNTHRLATYMSGLFGEPDPLPTASLSSGMKGEGKLRPRLLSFVREPCLYCTRGLPV
jgi:hypothetical protein